MIFFYSNIDMIIFISFLAINLIIGFVAFTKIKNIREYSVGNRDFSTGTIAATLIATWVSGSAFLTDLSKVYTEGLFFIVPCLCGDILNLLLICYFLAPRMGLFFGSLSIADAMGNIYGQKVRFITAVSSTINCIGKVAAQFQIAAILLQFFFGVSSLYATLITAAIITIYSAFGGIKAVTFTDIMQFFTFSAVIPIIGLVIWETLGDPNVVFYELSHNPLFDIQQLFNSSDPKFWGGLSVFIYFSFPTLNPAIFQRVLMAKNTEQVAQSFFVALFACLFISIIFFWIAILLLAGDSGLNPDNLLTHIINDYTYVGFKGVVAAGIMAMIMSTADSYINVGAITSSYDLPKSLGFNRSAKYDLPFSYIAATIIGILAFILSFYTKNLVNLFLVVASFYAPIVTVPLLLSIYGFRSTPKVVMTGMAAGLTTVLIWLCFSIEELTGIVAVIPGLIANIVFLLGSHYLLNQPGGFGNSKKPASLIALQQERKRRMVKTYNSFKEFSLLKCCKDNLPKQEITYAYLGFFITISTHTSLYIIPEDIIKHLYIYNFFYNSVLILSAIFITYPIWPPKFKNEKIMSFVWPLGIFYVMIFSGSLWVIASNFNKLQLMTFMVNLIIVATLFRWHITLIMTVIGMLSSAEFYKYYIFIESLPAANNSLQFRVLYLLTLFCCILFVFLRPKQQQQELTEAKNTHLGKQVYDREEEVRKLLDLKYEFLRNINHEIHAPLTGITSLGETLWAKYDQLNDKQRRQAAEIIAKSSTRLNSLMSNILDFSKLSSLTYDLNKKKQNLSELLFEQISFCKNLYLDDKELEFIINVEDNVMINFDEYYIKRTLDNLIINSINYSNNNGEVTINLEKVAGEIKFSIKDKGIGIPKDELQDIFGVFVVSSKTRTPAGGRGVGLALCKKVIEVHGGRIWAENDQENGSVFIFTLPL